MKVLIQYAAQMFIESADENAVQTLQLVAANQSEIIQCATVYSSVQFIASRNIEASGVIRGERGDMAYITRSL